METSVAKANISSIATSKMEKLALESLYGKYKEKVCKFWAGKKCSHHSDTLRIISADPAILDQLEEGFAGKKSPVSTKRSDEQLMKKYAFKKHILLEGDKGSGKTHTAHAFCDQNGWEKVFIAGNASMESTDLLGHLIQVSEIPKKEKGQAKLFDPDPMPVASIRWKDGPLSEAFRKARSGKKVVLIYDELLRTPAPELNILVGALSPINGCYAIRTGKAVGVGAEGEVLEETLFAPIENLWVIATTNVGSAYQVDEIDLALEDRFRKIRKDSNPDEIQKILTKEAVSKGYLAKEVVERLLKFLEITETLRRDGKINKFVNLRHLIEAIMFSENEQDIKETLWETRGAWIENDSEGQPIKEQEALIELTLHKLYK
jgi:MoxR-like ATPase